MKCLLCDCLLLMVANLFLVHGFVHQSSTRPKVKEEHHRRRYPADSHSNAFSSRPPSPVACSTSAVAAESAAKDGDLTCLSFRHCSTVYIEMTDMYGIVYHANYLTYTRRAIEHALDAPGVRVHNIHSMKYRAAATIGEGIAVEGNLVSSDSDTGRSRWSFELSDVADPSRVFVSAEATVSWPGDLALPGGTTVNIPPIAEGRAAQIKTRLLQPLPETFTDSRKTLEVVVWSDDLDGGGNLSIRALLNYFERIRTLSLGRGPGGELGLVRLHGEGVSVVVTSISDLRVDSHGVLAGDKLDVRLGTKLSRGNRVMTMYESLWKKDGTLVAHAEIALFCMDNETRKFRSVPPWVQDALTVPSTAADPEELF